MAKPVDFLHGKIMRTLFALALPIMMTYFVQTAYSLIDMIWIGRLGSAAVAGVGVSGMFLWFSSGISLMSRMGGQVKIGHSLGAGDEKEAKAFLGGMLQLSTFLAITYGLVINLFANQLIGFFHLNGADSIANAVIYLRITCGMVFFPFLNQAFTCTYNVCGDSRTPFFINTFGLLVNLAADPLFIFGFGPLPGLGAAGAAIATVCSQILVFLFFLWKIIGKNAIFQGLQLRRRRKSTYYRQIIRIGLPLALQDMLFSTCSMIIARFVAAYGDGPVAAQKIGTQIESITWMAADGFMAAINAFISQNYGAGRMDRVRAGYRDIMIIVLIWGTACSLLLILLPGPIFRIFLDDPEVLPIGIQYLSILGFSQLFMCAEITTSGAFAGLGNTLPPSSESIVLTFMRIPLILLLTGTSLGLAGIWWSISISSICKGIVLVSWYLLYQKKICVQNVQEKQHFRAKIT